MESREEQKPESPIIGDPNDFSYEEARLRPEIRSLSRTNFGEERAKMLKRALLQIKKGAVNLLRAVGNSESVPTDKNEPSPEK